jgi:cell division septal protein FtsQ
MKKYRYKKFHRAKKRKSIISLLIHSRFFWLACLILVVLGVIFYFVIFSSFFQLKEIGITGNKEVSTENIESIINNRINKKIIFLNSKSIFLANLQEISEEVLEKFPQIAKVDSKKDFPDRVTVKIEEREAVGVWFQNSNYFYIDKEGIIFEKEKRDPFSFQILRIRDLSSSIENLQLGKNVIEKEQLNQILKIESKLKNDLKIPLREISIISKTRLNVKTDQGWEIYFNPKKDIDWQLTELVFLLKERIPPDKRGNVEYIDLRFGKIYVFPETYNQ